MPREARDRASKVLKFFSIWYERFHHLQRIFSLISPYRIAPVACDQLCSSAASGPRHSSPLLPTCSFSVPQVSFSSPAVHPPWTRGPVHSVAWCTDSDLKEMRRSNTEVKANKLKYSLLEIAEFVNNINWLRDNITQRFSPSVHLKPVVQLLVKICLFHLLLAVHETWKMQFGVKTKEQLE